MDLQPLGVEILVTLQAEPTFGLGCVECSALSLPGPDQSAGQDPAGVLVSQLNCLLSERTVTRLVAWTPCHSFWSGM